MALTMFNPGINDIMTIACCNVISGIFSVSKASLITSIPPLNSTNLGNSQVLVIPGIIYKPIIHHITVPLKYRYLNL